MWITRAVAYFAEDAVKLEVTEQGACWARFVGGGGFVRVATVTGDSATMVSLETREWDAYVRQFARHIGR